MCGRMTLTRSPGEIAAFFDFLDGGASAEAALAGPDGRPWRPRYNIAPSQPVLTVLRGEAAPRAFAWKIWGLVPAWAKDPSMGGKLFNARSETVAEKPSFRSAFKRRRCLVVADGFYEWTPRNRGHRAHWLHPRAGALLAFAGLHEQWADERGPGIESCTVLTTDANRDLAGIHARMPVILPPGSWSAWLDPTSERDALQALLLPAPDGTLETRVVSSHVNDPRHDDPGCLEALVSNGDFRLDGGSAR
jgi:putative SOS response-associated peptidase YedK